MTRRPIQVSICILVLVTAGHACMDSPTESDSGPAVIEGRVERIGADTSQTTEIQNVEGAVVTAAEVADDGRLKTIGEAEAETDAQGEFTLEIPGADMEQVKSVSRIIIIARSDDGSTGKAFVTSNVLSGSAVQAKPVTRESDAEAGILEEVVARGAEGRVANADIEAAVDSTVAAGMEQNTEAASYIAAVLDNQAELKTWIYEREGVEVDENQQEVIDEILINAQVELENRLYDLDNAHEEQERAFDDFLETVAQAAPQAGIEPAAAAKASYLASLLIINDSPELPDESVAEMYRNYSYQTASVLDIAVRNQLEGLGAQSATVNLAEDAGNNLQAVIRDGPATTVEEIRSLFSEYRNEVVTAVENDAVADSTAFSTVNDNIGGEGGAKAAFDAAVEGISDPAVIKEAYLDFNVEVQAAINAGFDNDGESENIEAYTELLLLLNLVS